MLFFNCRGFASLGKKLSLHILLSSEQIDVIFLQETLGLANVITHLLESWLPRCIVEALDVNGWLGGMALGINSRSIKFCNIWGSFGHMGVDIYSPKLGTKIRIINVYGPCQNWAEFWNQLLNSDILQHDNIILGGDLNFSIGFAESWGKHAQIDPLSVFFENNLEDHNLIDIPLDKIQPTWRNNRTRGTTLPEGLITSS